MRTITSRSRARSSSTGSGGSNSPTARVGPPPPSLHHTRAACQLSPRPAHGGWATPLSQPTPLARVPSLQAPLSCPSLRSHPPAARPLPEPRHPNIAVESFSLFKKNIKPEWEDQHNRTGAEWFCRKQFLPQQLVSGPATPRAPTATPTAPTPTYHAPRVGGMRSLDGGRSSHPTPPPPPRALVACRTISGRTWSWA